MTLREYKLLYEAEWSVTRVGTAVTRRHKRQRSVFFLRFTASST